MGTDRITNLHRLGQSLWYDSIQRRLLNNGEIAGMIQRGEIKGMTSNPTIFQKAIAGSTDYDDALKPMAWAGWSPEPIFYQLAIEDIQKAADLFTPLYTETNGADGYVSLEVSPLLAQDTQKTIEEAKRLWKIVNRPNLMIKIPATMEGIEAIRAAVAAGINVNVTLIFSLERYEKVMDAYLSGLEDRLAQGLPIDRIHSVASFFVSRFDTLVDSLLEKIARNSPEKAAEAKKLMGKGAIANARLAYHLFQNIISSDRYKKLQSKGANFQRPLWASTSTKNPDYRDVLYIEELIGPHTVNTVPPSSLKDFADHGEAKLKLLQPEEESRAMLEGLEKLGISVRKVTQQLEEEGVSKFSDSYHDLLDEIERRCEAVRAELGLELESVSERITALENINFTERIFQKDPALWTDDPEGQVEARKRLGWLESPTKSLDLIPQLADLVKAAQAEGYKKVLLLGMGGSSLAPEVLALTFGDMEVNGRPGLALTILDSTDPGQVQEAEAAHPLIETLYIVASKSGTTSEVHAYLDYFWNKAVSELGGKAGKHFIAITDPGSKLIEIAEERGFRAVFLSDPEVGGRYSALTAFGLVPASLIGIDVRRLLSQAKNMADQCRPTVPAGRNPGLVLGAILGEAALQGKDKVTLITDPELSAFGSWLEQLIAESSGKQGQGIVPIDIEPLVDPASYSHDRLFVYLSWSGNLSDQVNAILNTGQPVITLPIQDAYSLGAEFFRWEYAVAVACSILGVNAFDQPDVQDNKIRTKNKITAFKNSGTFEHESPVWSKAGVQVFGQNMPEFKEAASLHDLVNIFLSQRKSGDYVAINAYLPRNESTLKKLQNLRQKVLMKTGLATTLGFGPRFLHSTGQLHKGGSDQGIFIQITAEPYRDLEIPTQGITFGTLEKAQALGDLEALLARGRRAIRVHFSELNLEDLID